MIFHFWLELGGIGRINFLQAVEKPTFSTWVDRAAVLRCVMPGGIMALLGCLGAVALPLVDKSQLFGKNDPLVLPSAKISPCDCQDLSRQRHLHTDWGPWVLCWGWWVNDCEPALVFVGSPVEAVLLWRCKAEDHNILMLGSISCSGFVSWWRWKKTPLTPQSCFSWFVPGDTPPVTDP